MFRAYGLYGHIQANRVRSVLLLAGFVVLLQVLQFSLYLLMGGILGGGLSLDEIIVAAWRRFQGSWYLSLVLAGLWFAIAYAIHGALIQAATKARGVERREAPELYNALENLCVSRGIPMPKLQIIDSPALNAYAAGLHQGNYTIAVTRGLIDTLEPDELEAVLAHELTHIINKDTQMMVIAIIFAGIFAFFADLFIRPWDFPYGVYPQSRSTTRPGGWDQRYEEEDDRQSGRRSGRGGGDGGAGALIAIIIAIAIILITWGVSMMLRFALSRSREYLADAGAVELTKRPEAMIGALRKISANPILDVPSRVEAFFIETPVAERRAGILSTHPSIDERIDAIVRFAGGDPGAIEGPPLPTGTPLPPLNPRPRPTIARNPWIGPRKS